MKIRVKNDQYPMKIRVNNDQYPMKIRVNNDQYPRKIRVNNDQYPRKIRVNNDQYPMKIRVNNDQYPRKIRVNNDQYPRKIRVNNDQYPRKMGGKILTLRKWWYKIESKIGESKPPITPTLVHIWSTPWRGHQSIRCLLLYTLVKFIKGTGKYFCSCHLFDIFYLY